MRLVPVGAAAVLAVLISGVLAEDATAPSAAATAPIPDAAAPAQPAPAPAAAAPAPTAPAPQAAASPAAPPPTKFSREQLEQLVAPIALYPDQLLGQILMASTYPAEIVEAARWVRVAANRRLKGEALAAALKTKGWDPSVMALVPFPRVLEVMSNRLDWLRDLGTAFVAQQADVMAAVQHLRHLAMAAGTLKTTPQCHCTVETKGETITIATVASEPVCVPAYHTRVVYGTWPYPDYLPIDFAIPYGVPFLPGFYIGYYPPIDVAWYWPLWGWDSIDWGLGSIIVDRGRYSVLASGDPGFSGGTWAHNSGRWGAVDAAGRSAAGAAAGTTAGRRGAGGAATTGGPGSSRAAAGGTSAGRGGARGAAAGAYAAHGGAGARWGGHGGHYAARGGGHFAGAAHFAGHGGGYGGRHFGGGHFAAYGGRHFGGGGHSGGGGGHFGGGGPHFALGGGGGGHGGGGGGHGGGGGGHGGGGGGKGH